MNKIGLILCEASASVASPLVSILPIVGVLALSQPPLQQADVGSLTGYEQTLWYRRGSGQLTD